MITTICLMKEGKKICIEDSFQNNMELYKAELKNIFNQNELGLIFTKKDEIDFKANIKDQSKGILLTNEISNRNTDFSIDFFSEFLFMYATLVFNYYKRKDNLSIIDNLKVEIINNYISHSEYHDICIEHKSLGYDCKEWRTRKGELIYFKDMSISHLTKCIYLLKSNQENEIRLWKIRGIQKELFLRNLKH